MLKKIATLSLCVLLFAGFMAGCSSSNDGGKEILAVYSAEEPVTLDPAFVASSRDAFYAAHLFETLLAYTDASGEKLEVAAAESYKIAQEEVDGDFRQVITFTIRSSGWSDGLAVKADDFVFAIERLVNPANNAPYADELGRRFYKGAEILEGTATMDELGVEAVDDTTLRCVMADRRADNLSLFAAAQLSPVRRDIIEQYGEEWTKRTEIFVSNGAFKLGAYTPTDAMQMTKNLNYWYRAFVDNGTINISFGDESSAFSSVRDGGEMLSLSIAAKDISSAQSEGIMRVAAQRGVLVVEMNQKQAPFNDANVREAFAKAFDPAAISYGAVAQPAYSLVGGGYAAYASTDYLPNEAGARAREAALAMSAAGYAGGHNFPAVELLCVSGSVQEQAARALADAWIDTLGVEVTVSARDAAAFDEKIRSGDFQLALCEKQALYDDPAALLAQYTGGSNANVSGYASEEFDQAIAAYWNDGQTGGSATLYEAEARLFADYAVAPVCFPSLGLLYGDNVTGVRTDAFGRINIENAQLKAE